MPFRSPLRTAAHQAGEKFYEDSAPCPVCDGHARYTSNGACVSCLRLKGSLRYSGQSAEERKIQKAKDHERYLLRLIRAEFIDRESGQE